MILFLTGLFLFFTAHFYSALRSRSAGRDITEKLGPKLYRELYSLAASAGLIAMIFGYSRATPDILYTAPLEMRIVAFGLMYPALVLIITAYLPAGYIKKTVKHPMLAAVGIWAVAHLITGASVRASLLFGAFLLFAVVDFVAAIRRSAGEPDPPRLSSDMVALGAGTGLYALLYFWLHQTLFGAPLYLPAS